MFANSAPTPATLGLLLPLQLPPLLPPPPPQQLLPLPSDVARTTDVPLIWAPFKLTPCSPAKNHVSENMYTHGTSIKDDLNTGMFWYKKAPSIFSWTSKERERNISLGNQKKHPPFPLKNSQVFYSKKRGKKTGGTNPKKAKMKESLHSVEMDLWILV